MIQTAKHYATLQSLHPFAAGTVRVSRGHIWLLHGHVQSVDAGTKYDQFQTVGVFLAPVFPLRCLYSLDHSWVLDLELVTCISAT